MAPYHGAAGETLEHLHPVHQQAGREAEKHGPLLAQVRIAGVRLCHSHL